MAELFTATNLVSKKEHSGRPQAQNWHFTVWTKLWLVIIRWWTIWQEKPN